MMPLLMPVLGLIVPQLVSLAEKAIVGSGQGPKKKEWVLAMLTDLMGVLDKRGLVPEWAKQAQGPLIEFVDFLIESEVERLNK